MKSYHSCNFNLDVTALRIDALGLVFEIIAGDHSTIDATLVDGDKLVLFWTACDRASKLPYPMETDGCQGFVWGWLNQVAYPAEPDHDGSNSKGWRVHTDTTNYGWQAFAVIEPAWLMHGK